MKNRLYLDYNSTAPLADTVKSYIFSDKNFDGNTSSTHTSGSLAKKQTYHAYDSINSHFKNNENYFLYFHSGATEGISTFFNLHPTDVMVYFEGDHPAVHAMAAINEKKGVTTIKLPIKEDGLYDADFIVKTLFPYKGKKIFLNYTYVHNETGLVWNLEQAQKLKEDLNCYIHVDCAQVVGKIEKWNELNPTLDFYTFSSHKFGGLKGVGFSFVYKNFEYSPLIPGGGQQNGFRGGTLNSLGIVTTYLALEDTIKKQNLTSSQILRDKIEQIFEQFIGDNGFIVLKNEQRASNTSLLCFKKYKGDFLQIKFDMANIDVSYGSACSAGSIKGSDTMRALGHEEYATNIIRISFGSDCYKNDNYILDKIKNVLKSLS